MTEEGAGAKTVNVVGALTGYTIDTTIDTLVLADETNSVTLGAASQSVTGGTGADTVTTVTGASGTLALGTGANVVNLNGADDISLATITGTYDLNLLDGEGSDTTVTVAAAHLTDAADVTEEGAGAKTVNVVGALTGYTIDTTIDTLVLADETNSVTLGAASQSVTGGTGADTVTTVTGASGTLALGTGANVVNLNGADDISLATITGTYDLNLLDGEGSDTTVTVAAAHLTDAADVTEEGAGAKTVNVVGALTGYTIDTTIDTLVLADETNSVTLGAASQSVTGGTGADTVTTVTGASGTLALGTGANVVNLNGADDISLATITGTYDLNLLDGEAAIRP